MSWRNNYKDEKKHLGIKENDNSKAAQERIRKEIYPGVPPPWVTTEGFIPGFFKEAGKYFIFGPWFFLWRWPYYLYEAYQCSPAGNGGCKRLEDGGKTIGYFRRPPEQRSWGWFFAVLAIGIYFIYAVGDPEFRVWFWRIPHWYVRVIFEGIPGGPGDYNPTSHDWNYFKGVWALWW